MKTNPFVLAAVIIPLLVTKAVKSECPNLYRDLDGQGQKAVEKLNAADSSGRCIAARELVRIEQKLSHFVEEYQVQCVIDQEIIDVQQRRVRKAQEERDRACRR